MNKEQTMEFAGLIPLDVNVELIHLDADGNVKPIFQENKICRWLLSRGIINPLWINRWYAVLLTPILGFWSTSKVYKNLVVDAGKAGVASRINGAGGEAVFDKIGWGTGTVAPAAGDTALGAEKQADATTATTTHVVSAATTSRVTTTVTNDTAQDVGTVAATGSGAITESGVFNAATAGTMLCRQTFSAVNVVNGDSLQFTWKIKAS